MERLVSATERQHAQKAKLFRQQEDASQLLSGVIRAEKAYTYKFKRSLAEGELNTFFSRESSKKMPHFFDEMLTRRENPLLDLIGKREAPKGKTPRKVASSH